MEYKAYIACTPISQQESQLAADNEREAEELARELPQKFQALSQSSRYANGTFTQLAVLCRKFMLIYWRSPAYNVTCALHAFVLHAPAGLGERYIFSLASRQPADAQRSQGMCDR